MPEQHRSTDDVGESSRATCEFFEVASYSRAIAKIGEGNVVSEATIRADVVAFRMAYRASKPGGPLPRSFQHKELGKIAGQYRVSQIYVGKGNYRVALLFIHSGKRAYLVDIFKKTKNENKKQVKVALDRAAHCWDQLSDEEKKGQ
jgi:hypothetical protein